MKTFGSPYILFFLVLSIGVSIVSASSHGQVHGHAEAWRKEPDFFSIGRWEVYDSLPQLEAELIFWKEATWLKSYQDSVMFITPLNERKRFFEIGSNSASLKLRKGSLTDERVWYEYLGYYYSIHCHFFARNSMSENIEFSELCVYDSLTGISYKIESVGDYRVENPVVSENQKFLAYSFNEYVGEKKAFVGVIKLNEENRAKVFFQEYARLQTDEFYIDRIYWSGDSLLLLDGTTHEGYEENYKLQIPE